MTVRRGSTVFILIPVYNLALSQCAITNSFIFFQLRLRLMLPYTIYWGLVFNQGHGNKGFLSNALKCCLFTLLSSAVKLPPVRSVILLGTWAFSNIFRAFFLVHFLKIYLPFQKSQLIAFVVPKTKFLSIWKQQALNFSYHESMRRQFSTVFGED